MSAIRSRSSSRLAALLAVALAATFLVAGPGLPIVLWDESRTIVNALEMRSFGLVTTFGGMPDLWNTKPPLAIWVMHGATVLFGPSLWALRLPALLAALGTVALVAGFVRRMSGSIATALLAAALLTLSPGFWGEHAARTADYDAPLTFFTALYALALFGAIHRAAPARRTLVVVAIGIAGALLTKSVAGLIPGVGVLVYVILFGRLSRIMRPSSVAAACLTGLVPLAAFAVAREHAAAGWIAAAWRNDVAGRLTQSLIGTPKPAGFYLDQLVEGWCAAAPLLLMAPVALALARGRRRLAMAFALAVAASVLVVISLAASKLSHYALPALPFLAIAVALIVQTLILAVRQRSRLVTALGLAVIALPIAQGAANGWRGRFALPGARAGTGESASLYGTLLPTLAATSTRPITIVDPGFPLEGRAGYTPVLDAYRLLWRARGVRVGHVAAFGTAPLTGIVASCDPHTARRLGAIATDVAAVPGCVAIRPR